MRTVFLSILPVLTLVACGPNREEFEEAYVARSCELIQDCPDQAFSFDSEEECVAFYTAFLVLVPSDDEGCVYNGDAGKACLAALDEATCETAVDGEPSACEDVYEGDACDAETTTTTF